VPLSHAIRSAIADEVQRTRGVLVEILPFTSRYPDFKLEDAYWVVGELRRRRQAQGERVVGARSGSRIPARGPATGSLDRYGTISMTKRLWI
jgi:2-keto-4-pentenoate hydratase